MKKIIISMLIILGVGRMANAQEVMNLDQYREKVLHYNQDIRSAKMGIDAAEENIKAAKSDKGPKIDAGVKYNYTGRPFDPSNLKPVGAPADEWLPIQHNYNANVTIRQDIFNGGRVKSQIKYAESQKDAQIAMTTLTGSELVFYADQQYWAAVGQKEYLALTRQYKESVERLVTVATNKYDAQVVSKNDVLMAQVKLNNADLEVLKAENRLQVSIMSLNRMMGVEVQTPTQVMDSISFTEFIFEENSIVELGLSQRAELQQAEADIRAKNALKSITASKYKGRVHVYAKGLYGAPSPQFGRNMEANYYAGAGFAMPIYHGGKKKRELAARQIATEQAILQKEKMTDQVILDVNQARYLLDEASKRVELTRSSLANADENLRLITDRYEDGLSPIIEVINAQINWQQAYADFIDSKVQHNINKSNMLKAVGELYK
ncbi:TolC family protein [Flammeovirga sp. MY04]|uniref:TolC family protein n=1 Tax=Flammeovirga sp. MY04 TaxID=1191459 RepID=UPI0008244A44|nr:TolC family protein [Flammeovirga sp. MY04]ANQ52801.2 TolC family protein [Flammeovirga sp. MY04]